MTSPLTLEHVPDGTAPLYERIVGEIRRRVDAGVWTRGQRLRSEADLASDLGVARGTLRRAIAVLVESGHLEQRQGLGTYVAGSRSPHDAGRFESLGERMERGGVRFETVELSRRVVAENAPGHPGGSGPALHLRRLRRLDGVPVSVLENTVPLRLAPGLDEVDVTTMSLYRLLETSFKVAIERTEMTFGAVPADDELAALLDVPVGAPLTHLVQTAYGPGGVVDDGETWIRPDRHRPTVSLWRTS